MEKKIDAGDVNVELLFPIEIMFEILSWLTVGSLLTCKLVCKRWKEIIQHPKFIQMHVLRSNEVFIYFTSESFITLDSRYGLLVEQSKISGKYHVRNPATKQILDVPDPPKGKLINMKVVSVSSTSSYKLVYIYEDESVYKKICFKVLSFEGSDQLLWRDLKNSPSSFCKFNITRRRVSTLVDGGLIYSIGLYEDGSRDCQIHCLNVKTEIFITDIPITVPQNLFPNWRKVQMIQWERKVGLTNMVEDDLNVWVLEDPIKKKWREKKIVMPLTFLKQYPYMKENLVPHSEFNKRIWFKTDINVIVFNTKTKNVFQSAYSGKQIGCLGIRSLAKLKGMQPKKKQKDEVEGRLVELLRSSHLRICGMFVAFSIFILPIGLLFWC